MTTLGTLPPGPGVVKSYSTAHQDGPDALALASVKRASAQAWGEGRRDEVRMVGACWALALFSPEGGNLAWTVIHAPHPYEAVLGHLQVPRPSTPAPFPQERLAPRYPYPGVRSSAGMAGWGKVRFGKARLGRRGVATVG